MTTVETRPEPRYVTFFDGTELSEAELFDRVGVSVDQWQAHVEKTNEQRTHCTVGAYAFTLAEFEAAHPNIILAQE